jgi:tetratricopeptide (TPR) repeat protein
MARIFISHSSRNNEQAVAMGSWLAQNGWDDVFLDIDPLSGLAPGQRWRQALREAADRCQVVLCLITPDWLASTWCFDEFLLAKQLGKCVLPVILGEVDLAKLSKEITSDHQAVDVVHDPQGWERLKEGLKRAGLDPETFPFEPGRRPYPGFEPLTEQDAAIFFGREAHIVRGMDRLRTMSEIGAERMFVVLGASGAGKSSYLRAGLWPRLKREDRKFLALPSIRPERGVLTGKYGLWAVLECAFAEIRCATEVVKDLPRSRGAIADFIHSDAAGLRRLLDGLRAARLSTFVANEASPPTVVVSIDQGEELFNEEGREEADRFMDLIATTLVQDRRIIVIFAMRSDSFPRLQNEPRLASIGKVPFDLPPLPVTSMRLVVEGPARVARPPIKLDPQLVEALLDDSTGEDTLPLLAFTLGRLLQDYGAEGRLTLAQYDRLGRVRGAVSAALSDALEQGKRLGTLPTDERKLEALLRETFIPHLARVNKARQFVRRVATAKELPARSQALVDLLVEKRLLLRDRRPGRDGDADVVEVTHEALLREWPELRRWLESDREFLIGKEQLAEQIASWRDAELKQKSEALLTGLNLTRAKQWLIERQAQDLTGEERQFIAASIARADAIARRRRQLSAAAACILLAITGAAVWQWIRAERGRGDAAMARAMAENRLGLARGSAEELVKFIATDLRKLEGIRASTVERLLTRAKASFDELSSAVGDDPQFQQSRAQMMSEFGETFLKAKGLEQASGAFEESLHLYRALAARDQDQTASKRGVADQMEHIGVVRQQQGAIDQAMENFQTSLIVRQAIFLSEPDKAVSYRDLAWAKYNIGEILMARRRAQESLDKDKEALADMQRALSLDPSDRDLEYKLSLIHVSIGVAQEALGRRDERLASYLTALDIRKRLHEANPDNSEWTRMLAWAYSWIGSYYLDDENPTEAVKYLQPCRELRLKLAKTDPGDLVAKYDLAWAYHYLGMAFQQRNDLEAAAHNFDEAYNLRKELVDLDTDQRNAKWRKDLALSYESLGDLADARQDPVSALSHYQSAINILEELIGREPNNGGWRDILAIVYNKSAAVQKCRGDIKGALTAYEQALKIREKLLAENLEDIGSMVRVVRSENLVGEARQLHGEPGKALDHYRHAAELARTILGKRPGDAAARKELATATAALAGSGEAPRACASTQVGGG